MIRKPHRICFRMTPEEFTRWGEMVRTLHAWDWSSLVRMALRGLEPQHNAIVAAQIAAEEERSRQTADRQSDKKKRPQKKRARRKTAAVK